MACNNATPVYWLGVSFDSALEFYSDIALTTLAPDGWYSVGGTYREISGGILGPPQPCPSCLVPCGTGIVGQGGCGQYRLDMDLGNSTGAVIIVFDPFSFPDRCTWTYDGVSASEYSSAGEGYLEGFVGTQLAGVDYCAPDLINVSGSMNPSPGTYSTCVNLNTGAVTPLTIYNYIGGTFVSSTTPITLGPYAPADLSLTGSAPQKCMMVVPKPNISPTNLNLSMDGPCGSTSWTLGVNCPIDLNRFNCRVSSPGVVCADPLTDELFTAHVGNTTGIFAAIGLNDWAFEDVNGVTHKAAGTYLVNNNGSLDCVTVSVDGIVTAITPCSGSC